MATNKLVALFELFFYGGKIEKSRTLKEWEIYIQDCIEKAILEANPSEKNRCWWQHTSVDIFGRLLATKNVLLVFNEVKQDLH